MMKTLRQILFMAAFAFACAGNAAAQNGFTINGTFSQLPDSMRAVLLDVEGQEPKKIAEATILGGKFTLNGNVANPTMCELRIQQYSDKRKGYVGAMNEIRMMVENVAYTVSSDKTKETLAEVRCMNLVADVNGGEAQRQLQEYIAAINDVEQKAKQIGYKGAEMYFASNANPDTVRKYDALEKKAKAELFAAQKAFVAQHPDYHISAYLMSRELIKPFEYSFAECSAMAESVKACPDTARQSQIARRLNVIKKYCLGDKFKDFALTATDNQVKHLSDYVQPGKYTFIDFWASWCGPCRAAIPHVRKLYKEYEGKMNFISISLDEKEPAWRKAMEQEKMEWTQLWVANDQKKDAAQAYFIQSIPRLILLNDKGEIVVSTFKPDVMTEYLKNNSQQFTIEGKIPGLKEGTKITVKSHEQSGRRDIAEGVATDGAFRITGNISSPTLCEIFLDTGNDENDMDAAFDLMLDNSNITVEAEHVDSLPPSFFFGSIGFEREARMKISGGKVQKEYLEYRDAMRPLEIARGIAHYNYYIAKDPGRTKEREAQLSKALDNAEKACGDAERRFIESHPAYAISLYLWCQAMGEQYAYTSQQLDDIWSSVQSATDTTRLAKLKERIAENRKRLRNTPWTDFTAVAPDGSQHKASEWVKPGEWAVIDFWASWCGPCRAAIPHVRKLYNMYAKNSTLHTQHSTLPKVNFLAVSLDRNDADWRKAMEQEKMEWTQLCLTTDLVKPVTDAYNVSAIPYMLVINDRREIVFAGHDPVAVETLLEKATKK